jgi:hypothetical protein
MPFVPVENTALVEVRMSLAEQKVENTLWVLNDSAWDGGSLEELCSEVITWWGVHYAAITTDQVVLREVVATDQTSETAATASVSGDNAPGTQIGGTLPGNCSLAVSFRTALRGRSFRGRNYVVGIPLEEMSSINQTSGAYQALCKTAYDEFATAISTASWTWVVASRFSGVDPETGHPIPRVAGVTTPITSVIVVDNIIDSQRRRLTGRGQ